MLCSELVIQINLWFIFSPEVIFRFETSNFTICSKFCETGSQSRNVTCVREVGDEVSEVDEEECWSKGILKPASMRRCNTFPCPEYVTTPFGPVSGFSIM